MDFINLTTNLKLGKPTDQEIYDIKVPNANMDIIDSNIKKLQDADRNFATKESLQEHTGNQNNPHGVTKQQIGLDKVVNRQQIYGIPGTVTAGGIPVFDGNGYTVRDSGFTIGKSVPPNAAFTDTTYGIADENVPGIIKSSDSIRVSSDGTASVVDGSHSHDAQYYAKAEANRLFFLNSNISQNNENEATRVPSCALLHEIIQQKDQQIQSLKNEISALNSNLHRECYQVTITPGGSAVLTYNGSHLHNNLNYIIQLSTIHTSTYQYRRYLIRSNVIRIIDNIAPTNLTANFNVPELVIVDGIAKVHFEGDKSTSNYVVGVIVEFLG